MTILRYCSSLYILPHAGDSIFARTSQHKLARFFDDGMRNELGVLARLAPLLPPLFPACAAIVRTIFILR